MVADIDSEVERRAAAIYLRKYLGPVLAAPTCGIILGSGLGSLTGALTDSVRLPYSYIPGWPATSVDGHDGHLVAGRYAGHSVVALSGRNHLYEGHSAARLAFPVRVLAALGASTVILTNAAGGIHDSLEPGSLMLISDHLSLLVPNPLVGLVQPGEQRFPSMNNAYDPELRLLMHSVAKTSGIALEEGVYCAVSGPSYETPAEVRMLRLLGADAVGMSTVPETIMARTLGLRVVAISCITNRAAGLSHGEPSHEEVLAKGNAATADLERLISGFVAALPGGA